MIKTTVKKVSDTKISKEETSSSSRGKQDEKLKKSVYTVSTPRSFVQKSTTADIYAQKKRSNVQSARAPKKLTGATHRSSDVSPMKDLLKSSPSSVSQISRSSDKSSKYDAKATTYSARKKETPKKKDLFVNVTVNSPVAKRRLDLNIDQGTTKSVTSEVNVTKMNKRSKDIENVKKETQKYLNSKDVPKNTTENSKKPDAERQRTKTRTLQENEVKILTPDVVDNNAEMLNLSRKLSAKPKAFYIDLDGEQSKTQNHKLSDEEISYEDDFESYESDFDSYHSEQSKSDHSSEHIDDQDRDEEMGKTDVPSVEESKEIRDEEKMLDSGSFDLREQRSAKTKPIVMDFIQEDAEEASMKKISLTDEGFQEMSSSSAVSSLKTMHADVLDRPLFIDFSKSKENKRKRRLNEHFNQRAKDLLGMITLHEMSYSLFEMKPITYDLYMATFGRSNYTQSAAQTFDDGISEEVQTEEVIYSHKWTQNPVEFSKHDVYLNEKSMSRKYSKNIEDYITKFSFMIKQNCDVEIDTINLNESYRENPLRVYFEQKDGVGTCDMLPYEVYKSKLRNNEYNSDRLRKFLKKFESRINYVLSTNTGTNDSSDLVKNTKFPFSKGYVSISPKLINDESKSFLKSSQINRVLFSQTKSNLLITVHTKSLTADKRKCIICVWDRSITSGEPVKILIAIDNIIIGQFRGSTNGIFAAALEDGSIHLWDLSEEPAWYDNVDNKDNKLKEMESEPLTDLEKDREWNLMNVNVGYHQSQIQCPLQACAYTSSAYNMRNGDLSDCIVGLELIRDESVTMNKDGGRKNIGQVISLQRIGIITIWSMVQEKIKTAIQDIGKAYWSKIKLEKSQTISLQEHVAGINRDNLKIENMSSYFNLHAAKRRLSNRKQEKAIVKKDIARPKSAVSSDFEFDFDRPVSAGSLTRKMVPAEKNMAKSWESGIICSDLKILRLNNIDSYLVARNCGEVLSCRRCVGTVKVDRFCVTNDMSAVTSLEVSPHGLPYFLAATDAGTVNLCSMRYKRVLLTLDCRNIPPNQVPDKCQSDHKGRFIGTVAAKSQSISETQMAMKISVKTVLWAHVNPCCIYALMQDGSFLTFELTHSDIYAKYMSEKAAKACAAGDSTLALLTMDGEVQAHRLTNEHRTKEYLELFEKYVALL